VNNVDWLIGSCSPKTQRPSRIATNGVTLNTTPPEIADRLYGAARGRNCVPCASRCA